jgi:hypothetical protein
MKRVYLSLIIFLSALQLVFSQQQTGFFNFNWDAKEGKIWLDVSDKWNLEFLYVNALSAGVGSNDIGLDRNQLGKDRIVKFVRIGPKALLIEPNYRYRAVSQNAQERLAVEEAFAQSVIWGFKIEEKAGKSVIDLTPFLTRDAHQVVNTLDQKKQGTYKQDESKSAVRMERTKSFPQNTEFDALVTFTGKADGAWIKSVTPDPNQITVGIHHSFIALPDTGYTPRRYDPRSGFIPMSFYDYAVPIDQPVEQNYIVRHRLEKKNPELPVSDPVEPIIYYIDKGCPEPIRSALMEGASWWNQAFEAAGYRNAFQVKDLPEDADPLDVRYNVINWVHRSTRGWSYGSSVVDPRTGEIIKGHVLLGSLRVRQDYLIAQGLAGEFSEGASNTDMLVEMALARLRQLSAHEVGHTLGLMHNFAASVNDRASVMDYPHPYVTLDTTGHMDFSQAYATGIGAWDKQTIKYGYQDFPENTDEHSGLDKIVREGLVSGLLYISDADARPAGGAHPAAHLWDNGGNAITELERIMSVRACAMQAFGEQRIPVGAHVAYLEELLVPLYYGHRYQVEAVAKLIGGVDYTYQVRGDGQHGPRIVDPLTQAAARRALLQTLLPANLEMQSEILRLIPPRPAGYEPHQELFHGHTGLTLDPLAAAESLAGQTLGLMMHPERLARIHATSLYESGLMDLSNYLYGIREFIKALPMSNREETALAQIVEKQFVTKLMQLASDPAIQQQVSATALLMLNGIESDVAQALNAPAPGDQTAHNLYLRTALKQFRENPRTFQFPKVEDLPPGSPIGCDIGMTSERPR